jgi:hypothetical protein
VKASAAASSTMRPLLTTAAVPAAMASPSLQGGAGCGSGYCRRGGRGQRASGYSLFTLRGDTPCMLADTYGDRWQECPKTPQAPLPDLTNLWCAVAAAAIRSRRPSSTPASPLPPSPTMPSGSSSSSWVGERARMAGLPCWASAAAASSRSARPAGEGRAFDGG